MQTWIYAHTAYINIPSTLKHKNKVWPVGALIVADILEAEEEGYKLKARVVMQQHPVSKLELSEIRAGYAAQSMVICTASMVSMCKALTSVTNTN